MFMVSLRKGRQHGVSASRIYTTVRLVDCEHIPTRIFGLAVSEVEVVGLSEREDFSTTCVQECASSCFTAAVKTCAQSQSSSSLLSFSSNELLQR
jgi:hypothetical protein